MTLHDWVKNNWLKPHKSSAAEVRQLLHKVERDLTEAAKPGIVLDWRLAIAYNACLGCATIALRASGFRTPEGDGHHYRTIESLHYTLRPATDLIAALQSIRRKRAAVSYDAAGIATESEVAEALGAARALHSLLTEWLAKKHPDLMSP
jgi:hypothetical protein